MRKWEDIVKDKMEEFDEALPESVFAEFQARRNAPAPAQKKRFPLVWALVPAVAAGLAAVLFLRRPDAAENAVRTIERQADPVAAVTKDADVPEPGQTEQTIYEPDRSEPQVDIPSPASQAAGKTNGTKPAATESADPEQGISESAEQAPDKAAPADPVATAPQEPAITGDTRNTASGPSPFIPETMKSKPVKMRIGPAAGIIAGGGLLASLAAPLIGSGMFKTMDTASPVKVDSETSPGQENPGGIEQQILPQDVPTGGHTHYFPLKAGLSAGIPIAERWKVTTGLEYSLYKSSFTYSTAENRYKYIDKYQYAHYLGIPLRLDWTLASNKRFDVYVGGGIEGDYCVAATLDGRRIRRDGFSFSLLGAGGVQWNFTRWAGLYLEPELSWTIPSDGAVLETYRSDHPLMFSVATGLRFNLAKKQK